jgi:hypothetical protein
MRLKFVFNNRILQIVKATSEELELLESISTVSGVSFRGREKKKWSTCYLNNWQWLPGGFWHKIANLSKKGQHVVIENIQDFEFLTEFQMDISVRA